MKPAAAWSVWLKYGLKWTLAQSLYRSGLLQVWIRYALRGQAAVLTYHRVLDSEAARQSWSHPAIIVRRKTFERHVALLRKHFAVLSLAEFEARLGSGRTFTSPSCLITFDDGWRDTYTEAWPVLQRFRTPAVVFLAADFIGSSDTFWQERLAAQLFEAWQRSQIDASFGGEARRVLARWQLDGLMDVSATSARSLILDAVQHRKLANPRESDEPVKALASLLGTDGGCGVDAFMTWDDVRHMNADGVTFGGHGVTHRRLTTLTAKEVVHEVEGSRTAIARELGSDVMPFCYPNGDWNRSIADVVKRARYTVAFATARGFVRPDDDRFAIRRINIHDDTTRSDAMFLARVAGLL